MISLFNNYFVPIFFRDIPLLTFHIQSVNKDFSSSVPKLKSINDQLWCLKCLGK